jgi:hypothetical protein
MKFGIGVVEEKSNMVLSVKIAVCAVTYSTVQGNVSLDPLDKGYPICNIP